MPAPLFQPDGVRKENGRWLRNCPKCGVVIDHLRRNYCIHAHLNTQPCKRCSNINNHPSGMCGSVRISWFNSFKKSAITRGYEWDITPEIVDEVYNFQGGKCSLSGLDIGWSEVHWTHTASIDRIDNSMGYTKENIHLVHKKINMMRGTLTVQEFKAFCEAVANSGDVVT